MYIIFLNKKTKMINNENYRFYFAILTSIICHLLIILFFTSGGRSGNIQINIPNKPSTIKIKLVEIHTIQSEIQQPNPENSSDSNSPDILTSNNSDSIINTNPEDKKIEDSSTPIPIEKPIDKSVQEKKKEEIKQDLKPSINENKPKIEEQLTTTDPTLAKDGTSDSTNNQNNDELTNLNPNLTSSEQGLVGQNGFSPIGTRQIKMAEQIGDLSYQLYFESWKNKVERIGMLNYPMNTNALNIALVLSVIVKSDGSIQSINIIRSSGIPTVDEAAINIVNRAAPFAPFPPNIQKNADTIEILKTWTFR